MRKSLYIGVLGVAACASAMSREARNPVIADNDQPVRIALATGDESAKVGGTGSWRIYRSNSSNLVARGTAGETMLVEPRGGQMVIVESGSASKARTGPLLVRATTPGSFVTYEGKKYRGELVITRSDAGLLVVNRL